MSSRRSCACLAAITFLLVWNNAVASAGEGNMGEVPEVKKKRMLFVFGDSYADTGNLGNLGELLTRSWYYPYGVTYPGRPTGRFSDGRLLTDFVASYLGIRAPPTYKRRRNALRGGAATRGMNFAVAGSGVLDTGNFQRNLSAQIDLLADQTARGLFSPRDIASGGVALVSVSGNDYWPAADEKNRTSAALGYIPAVLRELRRDLRRLRALGFSKVMVTNLHPIGCTPFFTRAGNYAACDESANNAAGVHNAGLDAALAELNADAGGGQPAFLALDLYQSFYDIAGGTAKMFVSPRRPCCESVAPAGGHCGEVDDAGSKQYRLCDDREEYFYWDDVHPSNAGWAAVCAALKPAIAVFLRP